MAKIPTPQEVLKERARILSILPTNKHPDHPIKFGHDGKVWYFACFFLRLGMNKPGTFYVKHSNLAVIRGKILSELNTN